MAYTLGPMIAPPLGGFLADTFNWRAVFGLAFGAGILILVAAYLTLHETHGRDRRAVQGPGILRGFGQLLKRPLFMAYVLQSGLSSGAFFGLASGSAFLMMDYLGRPATEYGFYFLLFAIGYCLGNWISSRLSGRVAIDHMVLAGSIILVSAVAVLIGFILAGIVTPLTIFVPGLFISMSQGIAMPNAQAGAIRTVPELAGTAAGIGVFSQLFCGGLFSQVLGFLADGTPRPVLLIVGTGAVLCFISGVAAFLLNRETRLRALAR
jgi:DHA1 family bicyclomycin/chloramphenicol resistance-like MFS transporter